MVHVMTLVRHDFGTTIALGIQDSNKDEIERKYFSFYNHQATSGELHWVNEVFAYFWTTPDNLRNAIIRANLFKLLNLDYGKSKGKRRGLLPEAELEADSIISEIHYLAFLDSERQNDDEPFKMGYLEYETPDINLI